MVGFGQTICLPVGPMCHECLNRDICPSSDKGRKSPKKSPNKKEKNDDTLPEKSPRKNTPNESKTIKTENINESDIHPIKSDIKKEANTDLDVDTFLKESINHKSSMLVLDGSDTEGFEKTKKNIKSEIKVKDTIETELKESKLEAKKDLKRRSPRISKQNVLTKNDNEAKKSSKKKK